MSTTTESTAAIREPSGTNGIGVPDRWYNVLADRGLELPQAQQAPNASGGGSVSAAVPKALVRQNLPMRAWEPIPEPVRDAYRQWRPTPLIRLRRLERELGTTAAIYMKYEAGNVAGSAKYNTAVAQAYYYAEAGVQTLITSTAAGQWGTAIAAAAARFGMDCVVHMVPGSYDRKPGRRIAMELLGADVRRGTETAPGRSTALSDVMSEAIEHAGQTKAARWILGGSEPFAILHSTVIGQETREQLRAVGEEREPLLIGYLGGGKNVGGLGLPYLAEGGTARLVAVESTSYPVLTRGRFRYDATDRAGRSASAKMYTLGAAFAGAPIQAESMRYHAAPKLFSVLREEGLVQAVAYDEGPVFDSARLLLRTEGFLASAEAAYAVHAACEQARDPRNDGQAIVFCLSDHGHLDTDAYRAYLDGRLEGRVPLDSEIE
ncbi:TrpB-like pyridoxal phosphate-dependent enzyme [Amycolatopsis ultiminotia]|uniref:tryptophan synthase n=1 Tax=Amycolatopsis ultiminotia TaxID=543629 RepID=A0ABP6XV77_9PSEU